MLFITVNGMRGWISGQPEIQFGQVFERVTYYDYDTSTWHRNQLVWEDVVSIGWTLEKELN